MSLEIFARHSLAQFAIIYGEIFVEGKGKAINPSEIETLMWGRMCAKEAGIVKTGFKIPYDNIKRAKVTLPYMPDDINYTGCCAIKKNGGLYTPCCGKVAEDAYYCKACSVDKEGEAKELEFGTTDDRDQNVEDGRFAPITFAEWMKAHKNMSLPEVYTKLREAGIALEIPANELTCRELPKRRKGRPAKSDDSVVDEDSVPKKKAKSPAASDDEKPKKKAVKAESDSESEVEAPKPKKKAKASEDEAPKAKKAKSPAASEDEAPKAKKAKSPAASEDEAPKSKSKKSPAASEDEAPKSKPKAKKVKESKPESDDEAPKKKAKSPAASEDEAPKKAKEPKAKKAKSVASEDEAPKKAKKAKKASEDEEPKAKKAKAPEPEPEPETLEAEDAEDEEEEDQEIEINGVDYTLRNGKFVIAKDDGRIVATVNDEGEPEWVDGEEP